MNILNQAPSNTALKKTEAGLIPLDWNAVTFKTVIAKYMDYRGRTPKKLGLEWGGSIVALSANNVQMGFIDFEKESYFGSDVLYARWMKSGDCEAGDILLTMEAPLGNVAQVPDGQRYILSQRVILVRPITSVSKDFLSHQMRSARFQHELIRNASGSTALGIQRARLEDVPIAIPGLKNEQLQIAAALTDADALIDSLEQLLTKKRQIKQGAMQELLTGKRRLPGFGINAEGYQNTEIGKIPEDWTFEKIGAFIDLLTGYPFPSSGYTKSGVRLLRGSNVKRGTTDWSEDITSYWPQISTDIKRFLLRPSDIVVAMDGSLVGRSFAIVSDADLPALLLQRVARIRSETISQDYLGTWICSKIFTEYCDGVKTTTAIPHIGPDDIRAFSIAIPPTKSEQTAIAAIISDMDADIATTEARLAKARDIKQAMAQALLTGRIRLVEGAAA